MTNTKLPYNDFGTWLKSQFPYKVQKISLHAGFTCPNRDGTKGWGGCTYCNNQTFNPEYCQTEQSIASQLEEGRSFFARKYPDMRYLAYFQAYTNTYGELQTLMEKYEAALSAEGVVGLVIGTRPDCIPDALLNYLEELNQRCFLVVELGIESTEDTTLQRINRGHTYAATVEAVHKLAERGIRVGGHVILGLPGEAHETLMRQADTLSKLPLTTLKMHQLQLIRGTRMAAEYEKNPDDFHLYTASEYADLVVDYVERLRPDLILVRFVSQSTKSWLSAPDWGLKNYEFNELVRRKLRERDTYQGRLYSRENESSY